MKILVRGTNWIGDTVMSVPALRELRRIFRDARITLHTRSWADGLLCDVDFIDEMVTFDRSRSKIRDVYDNSQFLRDDKYDLAILLPNSFESALTSFLTRVPRRIGYNKDARGLLLTDPVPVPEWKERRHEVFYYLNLVAEIERRMLGSETVSQHEPDVTLDVSDERKAAAHRFLAAAGVDPDKPLVALSAGSANAPEKRWPGERYAALNDRLRAELGCETILVGSKEEAEIAARVVVGSQRPPIDVTGRTDLAEAVAILSVVDLLVSNDAGPAHIAPAVGSRTIVIFRTTNPVTTRPFSSHALVLYDPSVWIPVDEVFQAARQALA